MKKNKNIIIISILSILFIVLSILVYFNLTISFDNTIYHLITINMNNILTSIYKVITFFGSTLFIISLCIFFLILFIILKKKNYGLIISCCLIISTIFNNLIKIIICRERPSVLKLVIEDTYSYPSGHTMASVSMYGILIYLILKIKMNKKLKIFLVTILGILPILVGMSRIYLGAHFATDIIGGFLLAITLLLIEINIIDKKKLI